MKGTIEECFPASKLLLCWVNARCALVALDAKCGFTVQSGDTLFDSSGTPHQKYPTLEKYQLELLLRSTGILFPLEPASTVARTFPVPFVGPKGKTLAGPSWPHTHTLDVSRDDVYVPTAKGTCHLDFVTITGELQWQRPSDKAHYYVIEQIPDGEAFAGALIQTEAREGHMTCLVFSPKTRDIGIHFVRLAEKHLNAIRELKLEIPSSSSGR